MDTKFDQASYAVNMLLISLILKFGYIEIKRLVPWPRDHETVLSLKIVLNQ